MLVKSAKVFEKLASFDLKRSYKGSTKSKLIKTEEESKQEQQEVAKAFEEEVPNT